jgi:hypothetical protein
MVFIMSLNITEFFKLGLKSPLMHQLFISNYNNFIDKDSHKPFKSNLITIN